MVGLFQETKQIQDIEDFVALDFETTGLNPELDRIIEFAACKVQGMVITDNLHSLINPEKKIRDKITDINGITNEMVMDAPLFHERIDELLEFIGELPIVAHNAEFDISFLQAELERHGRQMRNQVVDTLALSRKKLRKLQSHKLSSIVESLGFEIDSTNLDTGESFGHHRAVSDATNCAILFAVLKDEDLKYDPLFGDYDFSIESVYKMVGKEMPKRETPEIVQKQLNEIMEVEPEEKQFTLYLGHEPLKLPCEQFHLRVDPRIEWLEMDIPDHKYANMYVFRIPVEVNKFHLGGEKDKFTIERFGVDSVKLEGFKNLFPKNDIEFGSNWRGEQQNYVYFLYIGAGIYSFTFQEKGLRLRVNVLAKLPDRELIQPFSKYYTLNEVGKETAETVVKTNNTDIKQNIAAISGVLCIAIAIFMCFTGFELYKILAVPGLIVIGYFTLIIDYTIKTTKK